MQIFNLLLLLGTLIFFLNSVNTQIPPPPPYQTRYVTQTLDHFNYETKDKFYKQRFLVADAYWGTKSWPLECKGPIFFYTGNEAPVTEYYTASGFFTQVLAPKYGALLVFAEHRYFGESMPFGNQSFQPGNIGYCSSDQALADYAFLIQYIKDTMVGARNCPVIAFGGSYGGMLTTWFRQLYPQYTIGGLAASAPFGFYGSGISPYAFSDTATATFEAARPGCSKAIEQAFQQISELAKTSPGREKIKSDFNLCKDLPDENSVQDLVDWAVDGLQDMAMLDYPYVTDYGIEVMAWPVNNTCDRILSATDLVRGLANGLGTFYNGTGKQLCYDINTDVPDWGTCCAWDYLACTVVYLPNGNRAMFAPHPWNLTEDIQDCFTQFGVRLDPQWPQIHWGGFQSIPSLSHIIFSNGLLDPWHTAGVLHNISDTLIAIVIPESAHHLDLRGPHPEDPIYVTRAREQEDQIIGSWIDDYFKQSEKKDDITLSSNK
eukprot:TRINITY_DN4702_c0_g1_i1.p1 TRINITY_DN4702_c0_g1~~TRINITY_DN4702_c0_g1_i1.p1  ORF type:complete len:489 (-),score=72.58 TRINITY_DN4702_c0_g1_i1:23-1489(-)